MMMMMMVMMMINIFTFFPCVWFVFVKDQVLKLEEENIKLKREARRAAIAASVTQQAAPPPPPEKVDVDAMLQSANSNPTHPTSKVVNRQPQRRRRRRRRRRGRKEEEEEGEKKKKQEEKEETRGNFRKWRQENMYGTTMLSLYQAVVFSLSLSLSLSLFFFFFFLICEPGFGTGMRGDCALDVGARGKAR